jgi:hypothetical protein
MATPPVAIATQRRADERQHARIHDRAVHLRLPPAVKPFNPTLHDYFLYIITKEIYRFVRE